MPGIFGIMDIAKKSLFVQQQGVSVTGHNLANMNTEGYTRKVMNVSSDVNVTTLEGAGVKVDSVAGVTSPYVDKMIVSENMRLGDYYGRRQALSPVESLFDESLGGGIDSAINDFFNSWRRLSSNPAGRAERSGVRAAGQSLVEAFHRNYDGVAQVQKDLNTEIESVILEINNVFEEIATLNSNIQKTELGVKSANDFKDKRQQKIKDLAEKIGLQSFTDDTGHVNIMIGDGRVALEGVHHGGLKAFLDANGKYKVHFIDVGGSETDITDEINTGQLGGVITVREQNLEDYKSRLNEIARVLMDKFNEQHKKGESYGEDYIAANPKEISFFKEISASEAAASSINLSDDVKTDLNKICVSQRYEKSADNGLTQYWALPGDNENALELVDLQDKLVTFGSGDQATFNSYMELIVGDVAKEVKRVNDEYEFQDSIVQQLKNFREITSGVSIDDEFMRLIQYQKAYQASAKIISTVDGLIDSILSLR